MNITEKLNTNGGGIHYPDTIVYHAMSEFIDGVHALDYLQIMGLSAHYLIEPYGNIIRTRNENLIAYHAKGHNRMTIGIELLIKGDLTYPEFINALKTNWCKPQQMKSVIWLVNDIMTRHDIKKHVRHSDIDPKRKKDPGEGFDWKYFKSQL